MIQILFVILFCQTRSAKEKTFKRFVTNNSRQKNSHALVFDDEGDNDVDTDTDDAEDADNAEVKIDVGSR